MPHIKADAWPLLLVCFLLFLALVVVVAGMVSRWNSKSQRDWRDRR
jgi:hypothetical protein